MSVVALRSTLWRPTPCDCYCCTNQTARCRCSHNRCHAMFATQCNNYLLKQQAFFVERVRTNLHVVLCLSPIGDAFRTRQRMFPSLVNCCTIDWFAPWPQEALRSVARHFLDPVRVSRLFWEHFISAVFCFTDCCCCACCFD